MTPSRTALATALVTKEPAFGRVLEEAGVEARTDTSPDGARGYLTAERKRLLPITKSAGLQPH